MAEIAREILHVNLEDEMRQSYLDYAMSVIVGRALPDVRDGFSRSTAASCSRCRRATSPRVPM